jgi:hypothetical protein
MTDKEDRYLLGEENQKLNEVHRDTKEVLRFAQYLKYLKPIHEDVRGVRDDVNLMKNTTLNAAIGKDHVPLDTHKKVVRNHNVLSGIAVVALLGIIVFLLTGEKLELINSLHR